MANVRFGNTLFRVKFLITERLAVDVIVGTSFLNSHVIATRCSEQKIEFRTEMVPIISLGHACKDPDAFQGASQNAHKRVRAGLSL